VRAAQNRVLENEQAPLFEVRRHSFDHLA
jgi:hypothetical protein